MDNNTIVKTAQDIMENKYTNASFSNMNVVFVTKEYFKALLDNMQKSIERGLIFAYRDNQWTTNKKEHASQDNIIEAVNEVDTGIVEYVIFEKSDLIVLSKKYFYFLLAATETQDDCS